MKSIFKKTAIAVLFLALAFTMFSCDFLLPTRKLSGIYGNIDENGIGYTYTFDGDTVTYSFWNNWVEEVKAEGRYEIGGGKIKIISDEYFDGSVKEDGKYVVSKSISTETDEEGNESLKIGINSFGKMEEEELPEKPVNPENPDGPGNPENPDNPKDPDYNKGNTETETTITLVQLKETISALTGAADTENANFEASYRLTEVHSQEGVHTENINYYMQIKARGTDRYLKFKIGNLNEESNISQGNSQEVEIWYVGGVTYIKAVTWQELNGRALDKTTNAVKATAQNFNAVCRNLSYPVASVLEMGSEISSLLSDTDATATSKDGTTTYTLDCTGKNEALSALYRISKAFAVELASDKFNDADVNYSMSSSSGLSVTYTASFTERDRSASVNGEMKFKSTSPQITVPSGVSSAEDVGAEYKSWYQSLEGMEHR